MLEVTRKNSGGESVGVPDNEAVTSSAPRNNGVGGWVFHHFISLCEKRWRTDLVQTLHGLWG